MITISLCRIEDTGNYIELNVNSDILESRFTKLLLYTYSTFGKKNSGIDLSYLLEKTSNKESFFISLIDLGFPNALDIFYVELETDQNETAIGVTGNLTDIAINNLDRLASLEQNKDCTFVNNCGQDEINELLYNNLALREIPSLLELKKYDEVKTLYHSIRNVLTVPCEVFYREFTIYTSDNEVRFTLESIVSDVIPEIIYEEVEVEVDIETIPPRGEDIFNII